MTTKEYILKANERMIDSYLIGDFKKMDLYRILLNSLIDEEIKKEVKNMKPNKTFEMYFDYYNHLPEFIDCKTNISKEVWDNMYDINENLFSLFTDIILTPRKLKSINNTIDLLFDEIIYLLPVNSPILCDIEDYYRELFLTFIGIAEINEDFEIAANLKNYYDSYIK